MNRPPEPNAPWANVGEPVATLCRRAAALCERIAWSDLAGLPVYVVPQSAAVGLLGPADEAEGYTTPSLDLYLRGVIGTAWRGRGPCLVVNDLLLVPGAGEDLEPYFLATAVHEFAHALERPCLFAERVTPEPARLTFEAIALARAVAEPPSEAQWDAEVLTHGDRFIRAALHLCHRAERAGEWVPVAQVCGGWRYGLSPARAYRAALGDEPQRMAGAAIRDVLDSPAPGPFARLWAADLAHLTREETTP